MRTIGKVVVAGLAVVAVLFAAVVIVGICYGHYGPPGREYRERERVLAPLLQQHAPIQQVTEALHSSLGMSMASVQEPATDLPSVRERAARYPIVFYHSTMWIMTWLFFDAEGKLQDYYLCDQ